MDSGTTHGYVGPVFRTQFQTGWFKLTWWGKKRFLKGNVYFFNPKISTIGSGIDQNQNLLSFGSENAHFTWEIRVLKD